MLSCPNCESPPTHECPACHTKYCKTCNVYLQDICMEPCDHLNDDGLYCEEGLEEIKQPATGLMESVKTGTQYLASKANTVKETVKYLLGGLDIKKQIVHTRDLTLTKEQGDRSVVVLGLCLFTFLAALFMILKYFDCKIGTLDEGGAFHCG